MGREFYEGDWVYLCLYSQTGCLVQLNVLFKDEEVGNVKKKVKEVVDLNAGSEGQLLVM